MTLDRTGLEVIGNDLAIKKLKHALNQRGYSSKDVRITNVVVKYLEDGIHYIVCLVPAKCMETITLEVRVD